MCDELTTIHSLQNDAADERFNRPDVAIPNATFAGVATSRSLAEPASASASSRRSPPSAYTEMPRRIAAAIAYRLKLSSPIYSTVSQSLGPHDVELPTHLDVIAVTRRNRSAGIDDATSADP